MEIKIDSPAWLDESHPNFIKWQRARELSVERGKFVQSIVNQKITAKNLIVLDLGSGEGGTAKVFSENNFVVSFDLSYVRLKRQLNSVISKEGSYPTEKSDRLNDKDFSLEDSFEMTNKNIPHNIERVNGNAFQLPFANNSFDLIIIQDVIEHLPDIDSFIAEVKRVLRSNGFIYLSTPNKYSIFNFIADPHFGIPVVSILKRKSIKKYFLKYFRKDDYKRNDIAQLLSLDELIKLFQDDFQIFLNTKFSVKELFKGNKGIVWSDFHLKLISFCKLIKLDWALIKVANDKIGVINNSFTPTFYVILKKIEPLITRINTK